MRRSSGIEQQFYTSAWFKSRPERVQALLFQYSPTQVWYLTNPDWDYCHAAYILGVLEDESGVLSFMMVVPSGFSSRKVSGIIPERLRTKEQVNELQLTVLS